MWLRERERGRERVSEREGWKKREREIIISSEKSVSAILRAVSSAF